MVLSVLLVLLGNIYQNPSRSDLHNTGWPNDCWSSTLNVPASIYNYSPFFGIHTVSSFSRFTTPPINPFQKCLPFLNIMRLKMYQECLPAEDRLSTRVCDLVKDYNIRWEKIIHVGEEYWTWPTQEMVSILRMKKADWTKIVITYIRSGVIFYRYLLDRFDTEYHMDYMSAHARMLHPALMELDKLGFEFLRGKNWDTLHGRIRII